MEGDLLLDRMAMISDFITYCQCDKNKRRCHFVDQVLISAGFRSIVGLLNDQPKPLGVVIIDKWNGEVHSCLGSLTISTH